MTTTQRVAPTPQEADDHLARRLAAADRLAKAVQELKLDSKQHGAPVWGTRLLDALREYEATR